MPINLDGYLDDLSQGKFLKTGMNLFSDAKDLLESYDEEEKIRMK